jgi:hypothetical protein
MKTTISPRDWELLSEYIDQQLSPAKRARLEKRLKASPELQSALSDLERTRSILRSAPALKAPRSFALKPSMVPERKQRRIFPVFQFATAVASILLVFVLLGDLMGLDSVFFGGSEQPAQVMVLEAVEGEATVQLEALVEEVPAEAGRMIAEEESPQEEIIALATPEYDSIPEEPAELAIAPAEAPAEIPVTPEGPPQPEMSILEAAPPAPEDSLRSGFEEDISDEDPAFRSVFPWTPVRTLQVLLALAVLGSAAAAIYLKRAGL